MPKNIVDAYKEFNGQLIILISGLSGSGKTELGENICRDFKLKKIDTKIFYKQDYDEKATLANGATVVNYDSDDAIDWDKMNEAVNSGKKDGVVVIGTVFPTDKLNFKTDYHIHLRINKQDLKANRLAYIEKHNDGKTNPETESLRINALTYPYYLATLKRMRMDKYIDITGMSSDAIYDTVFDAIIKYINDSVYDVKNMKHKSSNSTPTASAASATTSDKSSDEFIPYNNDYIITYTDEDS